jgi:hypothetical protein
MLAECDTDHCVVLWRFIHQIAYYVLSSDWTSNTLQFIMIMGSVGCDGAESFVFQLAVQQYKD